MLLGNNQMPYMSGQTPDELDRASARLTLILEVQSFPTWGALALQLLDKVIIFSQLRSLWPTQKAIEEHWPRTCYIWGNYSLIWIEELNAHIRTIEEHWPNTCYEGTTRRRTCLWQARSKVPLTRSYRWGANFPTLTVICEEQIAPQVQGKCSSLYVLCT